MKYIFFILGVSVISAGFNTLAMQKVATTTISCARESSLVVMQKTTNKALNQLVKQLRTCDPSTLPITLSEAETLISSIPNLNEMAHSGNSPLLEAIFANRPDIMQLLIGKGAALYTVRKAGDWTPIHWAAYCGDADPIKVLIEAEADINIRTIDDSWTPLMVAARNLNLQAVQVLLNAGAHIDLKDAHGMTARQHAQENIKGAKRVHLAEDVRSCIIATAKDILAAIDDAEQRSREHMNMTSKYILVHRIFEFFR